MYNLQIRTGAFCPQEEIELWKDRIMLECNQGFSEK
jgi:hypothetical protein